MEPESLEDSEPEGPQAEELDTSSSSWIEGASYLDGTLTVTIKGEEYEYEIDDSTWEAFKSAMSFGSFYREFIRGT